MKFKQIKNDIMEAVQATKPKTSPYDTEAEVIRVDGSTAWVHIPGGVAETPVSLTIAAQAGDTVRVRVSGGSAWLVGNDTAPPTDDTTAVAAQTEAKAAKTTAESAAKIAGNTDQHFWMVETGTDTGAHITEVTREKFLADPANGGGNLLARSNGIAVRDGLTELATFSASGAQIGLESGAHSEIDADGQRFYGADGYTQLANIGYGEGAAQSGTAIAPYYTFGTRRPGLSPGNYSVAEGQAAVASGYATHAEGFSAEATGQYSHAEGIGCVARGESSHAQNQNTRAAYTAQTAIGKFNSNSDTALEIGNGTGASDRSNAMDVGWDGEVRLALDTTAAAGTTDGDLYAAITAAGWASEVIA